MGEWLEYEKHLFCNVVFSLIFTNSILPVLLKLVARNELLNMLLDCILHPSLLGALLEAKWSCGMTSFGGAYLCCST